MHRQDLSLFTDDLGASGTVEILHVDMLSACMLSPAHLPDCQAIPELSLRPNQKCPGLYQSTKTAAIVQMFYPRWGAKSKTWIKAQWIYYDFTFSPASVFMERQELFVQCKMIIGSVQFHSKNIMGTTLKVGVTCRPTLPGMPGGPGGPGLPCERKIN